MITVSINGDSGDGIQLLGQIFSRDLAQGGFFIYTEPDFPAEIRAPSGTQAGISGFNMIFADDKLDSISKQYDVVIALNPAGLAKQLEHIKQEGVLIINSDQFTDKDFKKAKIAPESFQLFKDNPKLTVLEIPITKNTLSALESSDLNQSQKKQCRNIYVLGVLLYLFERSLESSEALLKQKLKSKANLLEGNLAALNAGYQYFAVQEYTLPKTYTESMDVSCQDTGEFRQLNGNQGLVLGALSVSHELQKPLLLAGYPITPASTILHEMQQYKSCGVTVFQAEDEMAAVGAALGASYGNQLSLTCTSGPGLDLKMEMIGLAVMVELPLVIIDVQRAGPSTGMPTKTEQSDLLHAIHGRHGESPCIVIAPHSAIDCFWKIRQAYELALSFNAPVIILSDAFIANLIEVWEVPTEITPLTLHQQNEPTSDSVYQRDEATLTRKHFQTGDERFLQCLGGLEKDPSTGGVSYHAYSHQTMSDVRAKKIEKVLDYTTPYVFIGDKDAELDVLLVTWGSSYIPCEVAYRKLIEAKQSVALLRIDVLNPLPNDLSAIFKKAGQVLVFELNNGQLTDLLRAKYLVDAQCQSQLTGESFESETIIDQVMSAIANERSAA